VEEPDTATVPDSAGGPDGEPVSFPLEQATPSTARAESPATTIHVLLLLIFSSLLGSVKGEGKVDGENGRRGVQGRPPVDHSACWRLPLIDPERRAAW
jgi:hypothetical protein